MANDATTQWIRDQFRERGWSVDEIDAGEKYRMGNILGGIGGLLCLFIIGIPVGLPLIGFGLYRRRRYADPGERYLEVRQELEKEIKRRDKSGAALYDPVGEEWWSDRLP